MFIVTEYAALSMRKSLIECIHKGGSHTKYMTLYDLQYTNL